MPPTETPAGALESTETRMSLTPPLAFEIETLKEGYAALNRNDIAAMVRIFAEEVVWIEFAGFPGEGTYRGHATVTAHIANARATWAEGACEPQQLIVAGDKIVVLVHVHVRLKAETEFREGDLADVYTFRNGKVVDVRVFGDQQEALGWAGVQGTSDG
jgi:ketosteroid isomerase-like protein